MNTEDIAFCSICQKTFGSHEEVLGHKCLQIIVKTNNDDNVKNEEGKVLYMCCGFWELSHVIFLMLRKKELLAKAEQIHKMVTIFNQKNNLSSTILSENSCHFVISFSFASSSFFLSMRKITWLNFQQPKTRAHVEHLNYQREKTRWKILFILNQKTKLCL